MTEQAIEQEIQAAGKTAPRPLRPQISIREATDTEHVVSQETSRMEIIGMTDVQAMNLEIFRLVMSDTTAASKAIAFVAGERLKYELFRDSYANASSDESIVSRTEIAIRKATEALDLFQLSATEQ